MAIGIIAEYNPFHQGHAYQIKTAKTLSGQRKTDDRVVVVLSGCYVQRGEPAIVDKFMRTRMALSSGASLVIELPAYYATATAEWFARGGIHLLNASGLVDAISFGIEDPSCLPLLQEAARFLAPEAEEYRNLLRSYLETEPSYALAREKALNTLLGTPLPTTPNAILALEYLKACRWEGWDPTLLPVPRKGMDHRQEEAEQEGYPSAVYIRRLAREGDDVSAWFSNDTSFVFPEALFPALTYRLSQHTPESLQKIDEVAEGLENRILAAYPSARDFNSLLNVLKTKRYTTARLKRILLNIVLNITKDRKNELAFSEGPGYLRVLGVRSDCLDLLSDITKKATLPVVINLAKDRKLLPAPAMAMIEDELRFDRYYGTLQKAFPNNELTQGLIIQ